ncbi:MAG: SusE domain-containing protein [Lentimicrobium sp.]|nr:SusE domain-containing protein [Lentimicrobium sp.]
MKKTLFFIIALAGIMIFSSCKKEGLDPVLDMEKTINPVFTAPANNSAYVLLESNKENVFANFTWAPAEYDVTAGRNWNLLNSDKIAPPTYTVQMDTEGDNFSSPIALTATTETSYSLTVGDMNGKLLAMGLATGEAHNLVFRIMADVTIGSTYENAWSETIKLTVTPFEAEIFYPPIYLLGDATDPGWDNANALPMHGFNENEFAIVANLAGEGKYLKFIKTLGAWAPQWGTDGTGTGEAGPLVFRPTEDEPDPPAIPAPAVAGQYRIYANISTLTYTITKASETLYLLGDGTPAGWDNAGATPLTQIAPGLFEITVQLAGGATYFKFIETLGQWAPQYGTDANGTGDGGNLVLRPDETVPDPPAIPVPAAAGSYKITVDLAKMMYKVTPA